VRLPLRTETLDGVRKRMPMSFHDVDLSSARGAGSASARNDAAAKRERGLTGAMLDAVRSGSFRSCEADLYDCRRSVNGALCCLPKRMTSGNTVGP
jgi:hypothetical protein